ncbi:MAG: hypothetical protein FD159_2515 [Syntrophaceae bacterium]|nr:MAG: hypothetical protein FD159_2515 [Syntrophaceae bacterium]
MKEFDPFGWLERYFSAKTLHVVIRCGIMIILLAFLISRITSYSRYWFKPLWAAETLIFVVFLISYAIRRDPVSRSRGVREILIPLIGGVLPFTLLFSPVNVALLLLFVAIQLYRSRMEENKLAQVFPAYGTFAARSLWFWPHRPVRGR